MHSWREPGQQCGLAVPSNMPKALSYFSITEDRGCVTQEFAGLTYWSPLVRWLLFHSRPRPRGSSLLYDS